MPDEVEITRAGFQDVLTDSQVKNLRVVQLAMAGGVASFFVIVLVFGLRPVSSEPSAAATLGLLSLVHGALLVTALLLGPVLYTAQLKRERLKGATAGDVHQRALGLLRNAVIVRLGLLEGAAMLGLVTCLLGGIQGRIQVQPLYWLNAISAGLFVVFAILTLPTRDGLSQTLEDRFVRNTPWSS